MWRRHSSRCHWRAKCPVTRSLPRPAQSRSPVDSLSRRRRPGDMLAGVDGEASRVSRLAWSSRWAQATCVTFSASAAIRSILPSRFRFTYCEIAFRMHMYRIYSINSCHDYFFVARNFVTIIRGGLLFETYD